MDLKFAVQKIGIEQAIHFLLKDPQNNMGKLMDWVDRFAGDSYEPHRKAVREAIEDQKNPYYA